MKLRQLFESPTTAVIAFGRMNPPTIGHQKLVQAIKSYNGDHYVFLSQSQKPKTDPLAFTDKLRYAKFFFPEVTIGHPQVKTIIQALQKINELGYEDLIYVAGSDRVQAFEELINKYNGKDYNFKNIQVVSAGERDPDADGAEGMSASKMRQAAADGNLEAFTEGTPRPELAEEMFAAVRQGMGIRDEETEVAEEAPPGREKQVKALKKEFPDDEGAPYAIAWAQHNKKKKKTNESDVVIDKARLRDYLRMLIDDAIDKEEDINKLSKVLKMLVGKEIRTRSDHKFTITSEDVVEACKNRRRKIKERSEELPDGSTKDYAADGSYTHSGAWGKKFYDANGKLIKTQTPVVNGLSTIKYADGKARYIFSGGGLEARGPLEGNKPSEADYLSYAFGGAKFIFDARKGQPVIKGSITIGRLKVALTGKVLDRPAFHKNPRTMMTQILGGDPLAILKDPMAVKPLLDKGTAKIYLDDKEVSAEQLSQAVEQGL